MNRIVVFANGELRQPELLKAQLRAGDRIFCADGGTRHALALGLTPEAIIGDLDSVALEVIERLQARGVRLEQHPPRKDETDLELALNAALAEQPEEIMLVTALGGRLDQMLANVLLLTRSEYASVRLTLADGATRALLIRPDQRVTVMGRPGDTLSLVPLTPEVTGVEFSGVEWPLRQATLTLGSSRSISNRLQGNQASLRIEAGLVLLVHLSDQLSEGD